MKKQTNATGGKMPENLSSILELSTEEKEKLDLAWQQFLKSKENNATGDAMPEVWGTCVNVNLPTLERFIRAVKELKTESSSKYQSHFNVREAFKKTLFYSSFYDDNYEYRIELKTTFRANDK
ncbi:MAG: hypothetical protein FWC41_03585 [Firmicutes bacterium]|nr:hypothetical protein [Bacillota bacterium]